jgi:ribosomal protein S6--L-glutamate ligase
MTRLMEKAFIALGSRLLGVPEVRTLGVKPNFLDYSPQERRMIFEAPLVLFPTDNYAQFLGTMGKRMFPSLENHLYADEKIKQTTLFNMLGIPHPRTKVFYARHHGDILREFSFPFVGKIPRCSARGRGVFLIRHAVDLTHYLKMTSVAYIQEYLPHERDLRVILINYDPVLAYWRECPSDNFRTNLFQGGRICFTGISREGIEVGKKAALSCKWDDVGMDLICSNGNWYVIEANMKYGREGLKMKNMDLKELIRKKLLSGELLAPAAMLRMPQDQRTK